MADRLFHVSDQPGIVSFDPRPAPSANAGQSGEMVWVIDQEHLHNYLLPRQCPRVTFYRLPESDPADAERLMAGSTATYIVAIESGWLAEVKRHRLYLYELPVETFTVADAGAGYYISRESVVPTAVTVVDDLLEALLARDVELRVMPSLWKLRDMVIASTLQFSIIRWRNARQPEPRTENQEPRPEGVKR